MLTLLPCNDSDELAERNRRALDIPRLAAAELGRTAVEMTRAGRYDLHDGRTIEFKDGVEAAIAAKTSIPPDTPLPEAAARSFSETRVQVANETTLTAARRIVDRGHAPLALNFANGVAPGGGFLHGARAQEEVLCRSSALYSTLIGDPMYEAHRKRSLPDSTDWCILSPDVPVFRHDDGTPLEAPWPLSFITCAAPYAPAVGQPRSGDLLEQRIRRVLAVARAHGYTALVLGAWGCGAFENDPRRTARDFRTALENEFEGAFEDITFAVVDWSPNRRFLKPFREAFAP